MVILCVSACLAWLGYRLGSVVCAMGVRVRLGGVVLCGCAVIVCGSHRSYEATAAVLVSAAAATRLYLVSRGMCCALRAS